MEELIEEFYRKLKGLGTPIDRYLASRIDWSNRCIAIVGSRGVGKTTFVFQRIKSFHKKGSSQTLYISLDNLYFTSHTLKDVADTFVKNGGKYLYIDEAHKYPNWSLEIKNLYDSYPDLHIIITGSSILDIYKGQADLSRRVVLYSLHGLSFREFLKLEGKYSFEAISLESLLKGHREFGHEILDTIQPIPLFKKYLEYGYYPFFKENLNSYPLKLANTINLVIEADLPAAIKVDYASVYKMKKLLQLLSTNTPYTVNTNQLSAKLETTRESLLKYLSYLERAQLINLLKSSSKGDSVLTKPDKIYLNNTNSMYAISRHHIDNGNLRETFFYNVMNNTHKVNFTKQGDFLIDETYVFEIGGKNKGFGQVADAEKAYIAADDIETGYEHKIPLWLFGFLY